MKTLFTIALLFIASAIYSIPLHVNHSMSFVLNEVNSRGSLEKTGVDKDGLEFILESNEYNVVKYVFSKDSLCMSQYTFYNYIELDEIKQQLSDLINISDSVYVNTVNNIVFELIIGKDNNYVVIINYLLK